MKTLFFPVNARANHRGLVPLKLRVTLSKHDMTEWFTGKHIDPAMWDSSKKIAKGKSVESDVANKYMAAAYSKLLRIVSDFELSEVDFNTKMIKEKFEGNHVVKFSILQALNIHNDFFKAQLGKPGFGVKTYNRYTISIPCKLERFMLLKYNRTDMFMAELDLEFIESFYHFLVTEGKQLGQIWTGTGMDAESALGIITKVKKVAAIGVVRIN